MGRQRAFRKQRQLDRLIAHQQWVRRVYLLDGPAWGDAWPHLDDWFKPEAFFIGRGTYRPAIAW